ncbi:lipoprotein [Spiroplasma endosymbiont of Panorpa germanica]|uniref:lipoprotein n=1 Tax=Spiroplasma endosymbiont of Panorpa germanica TaxID=3066314 RepID=UPI0030D4A9E1
MKKLLSILAAFGLSASAATSVVACDSGDSASEKLVKDFYKNLKAPANEDEAGHAYDDLMDARSKAVKEIKEDVFDTEEPEGNVTQEELDAIENHEKAQLVFAYNVTMEYYDIYDYIWDGDKQDALDLLPEFKKLKDYKMDVQDTGLKSNFAPSKANKEGIDKLSKDLEEKINAIKVDTEEPEEPGTETEETVTK